MGDKPTDEQWTAIHNTMEGFSHRVLRGGMGVVALIVVDLILTGVLGYNVAATQEALHRINVQRCETGNDYRRGDRELWTKVLQLSGRGPQTSDQQTTTREFRAFIATHDAPLKC